MEAPDTWHVPHFDEEMGRAGGASFAAGEAPLMGRATYRGRAAHSAASADRPIAAVMNDARTYVVATTPDRVEGNNSSLIARLKAQPGTGLAMSGSATLVEWLLHAGLLDELRWLAHPIDVGRAQRPFADGEPRTAPDLVAALTEPDPTGGRVAGRVPEANPTGESPKTSRAGDRVGRDC
jgi:dihydrofolate reductase